MTTKDSLDLSQLADYEIIGELSGRGDAATYLATRRADNRAVLISVVREPAGDEGNALSHLAADTNLLAGRPHPKVVPVVEGTWLGTNAFAIVTDRMSAPTLEEMLSRRDEDFPFARVAAVLRDVNAAIEWARGQRVVHRSLRLDSVFVDPGSDDVRVTFAVSALPATGNPGADADARTIATLARAMLTRSVMAPEREALPLAELRPGLPNRVVELTDALLAAREHGTLPDVSGYIASIAMADELKGAEVERETIRREVEAEQRRIRAELAAEREAHDKDLAEQAKRLADERERERRTMANERETSERALAKERERMQKDLAKGHSELEKERKQLARERDAARKEREDLQRQGARARDQIAAKLAALEAHATLYAATSELPAVRAAHDLEVPVEPRITTPAPSPSIGKRFARGVDGMRPLRRNASVALLAIVALAAASAVALSRGSREERSADGSVELNAVDSVAGDVSTTLVTVDSMTPAGSTTGGAEPTAQVRSEPAPIRVPPVERQPATPTAPETTLSRAPDPATDFPTVARDSTRLLPLNRPDSVRRDSAGAPRADSLAKVVPRLDSLLPRRDTIPGRATN